MIRFREDPRPDARAGGASARRLCGVAAQGARAKQFKELKIEAILETPVNIVVTADRTRGGRHALGRHTQPQMAPLLGRPGGGEPVARRPGRGPGRGLGRFFDERELVAKLGLPPHLEIVAYLCVGYVEAVPGRARAGAGAGWAKHRPLSWVVHEEASAAARCPAAEPHTLLEATLAASGRWTTRPWRRPGTSRGG